MRIIANEFILPFRDGWQCHAGHLAVLGEGKVFSVFFYGSKEGQGDVRIYGSMRTPEGKWSKAIPLSEDDGIPHWNPVLFKRKDGSVVLFYKVGRTIAEWVTKCRISYDGCETWGESFTMVEGDTSGGRGPVRNKAIYLSDGSVLAPGSTEQGEWKCFFDRSVDDGKTWQRSRDLCVSSDELTVYESHDKKGIIQPTVWESESGVHALMRSTEGKIYRTDSTDLGATWCEPYATDMPNNNSGIDLARLPDGRLILACNPVSENWGSRTPLTLYVSEDDGKSFEFYTHLITMEGKYAYPAVIYENGKLHIIYTWNRKTMQYMCLDQI
ncbi:MAG: exo-alpha-sialidase [Clostridia bacterium]|nr:exo-alpha-sialidase [Clostridia bacterium]